MLSMFSMGPLLVWSLCILTSLMKSTHDRTKAEHVSVSNTTLGGMETCFFSACRRLNRTEPLEASFPGILKIQENTFTDCIVYI